MGEFGDKFRKAREKKELSYDDVSNVTKISSRMLQAIEDEHFDLLPGGVFNKGFIRAYAKHLGLNDEEAVTDYLACLRQAQVDAHEVWEPKLPPAPPRPPALERRRSGDLNMPPLKPQAPHPVEELPGLQLPRAEDVRPRRKNFGDSSREIPWRILAVAAVVVVLAVILWTRRSHHPSTAAANTSPAITAPTTAQATAPQIATPQSAPAATSAGARASQPPQTAPTAGTPAQTPNSQPPQITPPAVIHPPDAAPNPSAAEADDKNDVTVRSFSKPNTKTSEKSAPSLTLVIRATETSWISVSADGQPVNQETLIAPAHTSVRANREIVARIGNAAGVTFLFNGHEVPADGAEAEVKTFVFDSTGMRVVPSTQPASQNQ